MIIRIMEMDNDDDYDDNTGATSGHHSAGPARPVTTPGLKK